MNSDLGLTAREFGFAAGVFFIGYIIFAMPANLMLHRIGASRWIAIIAVVWGSLSFATAFVKTPLQFFTLRFLLGVAESGFFPGVMLYTTYWFPEKTRGRITATFFIAVPLSNVFGAPLSSWLLTRHILGLRGWQTMFLIESLPAIALGLLAIHWLSDTPRTAAWLKPDEREAIERLIAPRESVSISRGVRIAVFNRVSWILGVLYFLIVIGLYGFGFWAPQILQTLGNLSAQATGWAVSLPYLAATVCMYFWSRHSDLMGERFWHLAIATLVSAIGFYIAGRASSIEVAMLAFTLATVGFYSAWPIFWTLPSSFLTGAAAASGIGLVNSMGNIAGYVAPLMMGWFKSTTGGYAYGINMMAVSMAGAGALALFLKRGRLTIPGQ